MDLLRISTAGSVDDGKSTLIGRLLYESGTLLKDQFQRLQKNGSEEIPWAHLTDGLKAEREQGITIDVAYRYFATRKRKFIIADTPGHAEFTRNMATGASTAELALILIDASKGIRLQSLRHTAIARFMGIKHLVFVLNKMDLVDYRESVFKEISTDIIRHLGPTIHPKIIPISAISGDNIAQISRRTPYYQGPPLLDLLESVEISQNEETGFALPVQYVLRPDASYRGYSGTVAAGQIKVGDSIKVLPTGHQSKVKSIVKSAKSTDVANQGSAISLELEDELAVSRGDVLVKPDNAPPLVHDLSAQIVWFNHTPLKAGQSLLFKHATQLRRITIGNDLKRLDLATGQEEYTNTIGINDLGVVRIHLHRPLVAATFQQNKTLGSFVLIDPVENHTLAAGIIHELKQDRQAQDAWFDITLAPDPQALEIAQQLENNLFQTGIKALALDARKHPAAIGEAALSNGVIPIWANRKGEPGPERLVINFISHPQKPKCHLKKSFIINRYFVSPDEAALLIQNHIKQAWRQGDNHESELKSENAS